MKRTPPTPRDPAELRRKAEARLRGRKRRDASPPATESDIRRLVHELQVHQIELEMQNEELAQSRAEMEALLRQYANLYDFAPVGYFALARDGSILRVNLAGARLLGVEAAKLINRRFAVFVPAQSRASFNSFLDQVFATGNRETCELALLKDGPHPLWAQIEASISTALPDHAVCHAVVSDITARKQAEEELRHLGTHDALTGLCNRTYFVEEMARLERGRAFPVSIVMADVDHLKETNDRDGHAAGDALLKRVAQVLTAAFRAEDLIARIGGDEFAVLLPCTDTATAEASLQRARQVLEESNAAQTGTPIRLSLGVSTAERPKPLSLVLREADASMYREKRGHDPARLASVKGELDAAELRRHAEETLRERKNTEAASRSPRTDTRRLVHELQVHQIELEMQNLELIHARSETEAALRHYADLYDSAPAGYFALSRDGTIHKSNVAGTNLLGVDRDSLLNRRFGMYVSVELRPAFSAFLDRVFATGGSKETCEVALIREGSEPQWAHIEASTEDRKRCRAVVVDITERKRAEDALQHRLAELEALHAVSAGLRAAKTRDEALPILLDEALAVMEADAGAIWLYDPESVELRLAASRGWFHHLDEGPLKPGEGVAGTVFASGQGHISVELRSDPVARAAAREQIPSGWGSACVPIRAGSETVGVLFISVPLPRQIAPEEEKLLRSLAEMAGGALHRMSLHEATVRQLDQLESLHRVDNAIATSTDLRMTLNTLLEHVTTQLKVDAACVLLVGPDPGTLEYAAGRGFRTDAPLNTGLRLGEGDAGRAALEQKLVHIPDLRARQADSLRSPLLSAEGFVTYYGIPLIAKGTVKGVLELLNRAPLDGDSAWLKLLETLAGQAAIAIDNAQLFENLQRANLDLTTAYDSTIEGWSRALDLRDRETEGHTLRVTEITMRLAQAAGVGEAEFVHIRRGALLHDIGKMGVPDGILLKPDRLTDDEWVIMRKHPQLALDLLAPITYLRPALDIPYCHHEKWDGTGYPRGIKGEQIPLAARLFAVVDVWDALRSDRPYCEAWPEKNVLEYVKAGSGTHFDPKAVELFIPIVNEGRLLSP